MSRPAPSPRPRPTVASAHESFVRLSAIARLLHEQFGGDFDATLAAWVRLLPSELDEEERRTNLHAFLHMEPAICVRLPSLEPSVARREGRLLRAVREAMTTR